MHTHVGAWGSQLRKNSCSSLCLLITRSQACRSGALCWQARARVANARHAAGFAGNDPCNAQHWESTRRRAHGGDRVEVARGGCTGRLRRGHKKCKVLLIPGDLASSFAIQVEWRTKTTRGT